MNQHNTDVGAFHAKFGLDVNEPNVPAFPTVEVIGFRLNFLLEELDELANASDFKLAIVDDEVKFIPMTEEEVKERGFLTYKKALGKALDACVDLEYVLQGTIRLYGFHGLCPMGHIYEEAWRRVQRANMSKVRVAKAGDSKRKSTYDVVKPEGWQPPKMDDLV